MDHDLPAAFNWVQEALTALEKAALLRTRRTAKALSGCQVEIGGQTYLSFASNDYLGMAGHTEVTAAAAQYLQGGPIGAGASPLISGYQPITQALESLLAEFEQAESALVFSSGFAANVGIIASLVAAGDVVLSDALNHASLIDGCRLSQATVAIYRHNDMQHLSQLLREHSGARRRLVVTDTLFSMDGDCAPLAAICDLAEQHQAMLLVDEAHATGIFGSGARGVADAQGVCSRIPLRMGTLSKALGCQGGFVVGRQPLMDYLVNKARSYVFSTALSPAACAAAITALNQVRRHPKAGANLLLRAAQLRTELQMQGWNTGSSASQIIPIILGDPQRTLAVAQSLWERGLWVPAIRPPSVPAGSSRLRLSLTAAHTQADTDRLLAALAELRRHARE